MRVLHITTEYPPFINGGIATAVAGLVKASTLEDIEAKVIHIRDIRRGYYRYGRYVKISQLKDFIYNKSNDPFTIDVTNIYFAIDTCISLIKQLKPDIIHLHTIFLLPIAYIIKEQFNCPLIYTMHSLERHEEYQDMGPLEYVIRCSTQDLLVNLVDCVIVLSRTDGELLAKYYPKISRKIKIIGNGIDTNDIKVRFAHNLSKPKIILYVGRLVKRKGIEDILNIIPKVLQTFPRTYFVLVGGQPNVDVKELEKKWISNILIPYRKQIIFTGWLEEERKNRWYDIADVLIIPSRYEPFGIVILEGMKHSLPIVASTTGGSVDILEHGNTGLLFPPGDTQMLAYALVTLLKNPFLRQKLGTTANKELKNRWQWSMIIQKMKRVYYEVTSVSIQSKGNY